MTNQETAAECLRRLMTQRGATLEELTLLEEALSPLTPTNEEVAGFGPDLLGAIDSAIESHRTGDLDGWELALVRRAAVRALSPRPLPEEMLRGLEELRNTFRREEEDASGHESWRAAMQAARVSLSRVLSAHRDALAPAPAQSEGGEG